MHVGLRERKDMGMREWMEGKRKVRQGGCRMEGRGKQDWVNVVV